MHAEFIDLHGRSIIAVKEPQRMVICLAISPPFLLTPPSRTLEVGPAFFSKSFQNFKLSSAAKGEYR